MNNYIYVPGLSESVEAEMEEVRKKQEQQVERIVTVTGAVKKKTTSSGRDGKRIRTEGERDIQIPTWQKYALTIKEAAAYYSIAESKLREFVQNSRDEAFVLKAGGRLLVNRKLFERFLDQNNTI